MIDPDIYIKEGLKIVKALVDQDHLQGALRTCQELLKVNPYHRKAQKYLKNIEEIILQKNIDKVDSDIDATMHLWKENRYEDLLKIYSRLYPYAPQHGRLRKLIMKLNQTLSEQQKDERRAAIHQALAEAARLVQEKRFGDAIQQYNEALRVDPLNSEAASYLAKAKNGLVEKKLKENERIVDSGDFERALEFYDTLLAIDPENQKVKQLALEAKEHLAQQKALAAKIHLNESIVRMKELFSNAEYEKVIQACEEIDRLDPGNFSARVFRRKAEHTIDAESSQTMVKKLKETWAAMAPEYTKNPEAFVKV